MGSEKAQIVRDSQGNCRLRGPLNFHTVSELHRRADFLSGASAETRIDLQDVDGVDSAGVALLLDWIEQAQHVQAKLHWLNMPDQMTRLIRINRLEEMFHQMEGSP